MTNDRADAFVRRKRVAQRLLLTSVLVAMWLLGMVSAYTMGGFIHALLVLAIIVALFNVLGGRRVFG